MRPPKIVACCCLLCVTAFLPPRLTRADPGSSSGGLLGLMNQPLGEDEPVAPRPALKQGSQGQSVLTIQKLLNVDRNRLGGSAIGTDGDFGPETETALRAFQREHGLETTGVVDAETWTQLDAVNAPPSAASTPSSPGSTVTTAGFTNVLLGNPVDSTINIPGAISAPTNSAPTNSAPASSAPATSALTTAQPVMHLSASSLDTLARLIESEAGVCSDEGKIAVGAVVLNRVRAGYANGTVLGVVSESGQFDGYDDATYRSTPSQASRNAAASAAAGQDPSNGATYYFNPYLVSPSWARTMKQTARIGTNDTNTHVFFKP